MSDIPRCGVRENRGKRRLFIDRLLSTGGSELVDVRRFILVEGLGWVLDRVAHLRSGMFNANVGTRNQTNYLLLEVRQDVSELTENFLKVLSCTVE